MSSGVVVIGQDDAVKRGDIALLGEESSQQLSMRVQEILPGQSTPLHIHHEQAETFYVVQGEFRFRAGDWEVDGQPGITVHIPKGVPHCFAYLGRETSGQLISVLTPGIHDGFIRDIPSAQKSGVSPEVLADIAAANGATILGTDLDVGLDAES